MILLDEKTIRAHLPNLSKPINFHIFPSINSTNLYLKQNTYAKDSIEICLAEEQTAGRGRFGRQWTSPYGENIYFSYSSYLPLGLAELSGFSLTVALTVLQSFAASNLFAPILIKWPNDLMWNQKKLGGILIESVAEKKGDLKIIVGIGINVNTDPSRQSLGDRPSTTLYEITGKQWDRNFLIAHLIQCLEINNSLFLKNGFTLFSEEWKKVDFLYGKQIEIYQTKNTLPGIACGVNALGELCIEDSQGKRHFISSGEASLRGFE